MANLPRPEPIEYVHRVHGKTLAVYDSETDPFLFGRDPRPFTCCFFDGSDFFEWWGDDCVEQFFAWLDERTALGYEYLIYAHNGGNFDFHEMLDYLDDGTEPFIMGGRLVKIMLRGQEFRDSYSIIPVPLGAYKKDDIDYTKMERDCREVHKHEILSYQRGDCAYLYELVSEFHTMFGDKLTMASVALPMLRSFHGFHTLNEKQDEQLRPYFFGGRCQAFETGILTPSSGAQFLIYDRNSMYPTVMKNYKHPIDGVFSYGKRITAATYFVKLEARNRGALCFREDDGGLDFTRETGTFYASVHEVRAGLETGTLDIIKIIETVDFHHTASFGEFVDHFYNLRLEASANDDEVRKLFYKLVLNSSYGKFAMDPRKFEDQFYARNGHAPDGDMHGPEFPEGWFPSTTRDDAIFWTRPNPKRLSRFLNVATAASITGASRADLLRALCASTRAVYCDTDSVICEGMGGRSDIHFSPKELGGWKTEATGDIAAIAGKKLYAVWNAGENIKKASKGVRLTPEQILEVAGGAVIEYPNPVPKFKLDGRREWTTRTIKRTA